MRNISKPSVGKTTPKEPSAIADDQAHDAPDAAVQALRNVRQKMLARNEMATETSIVSEVHIDGCYDMVETLNVCNQLISSGDVGENTLGSISWLLGSMAKQAGGIIQLLEKLQHDQSKKDTEQPNKPTSARSDSSKILEAEDLMHSARLLNEAVFMAAGSINDRDQIGAIQSVADLIDDKLIAARDLLDEVREAL